MKKSLLALFIGSAVILSGCKDEQLNAKLLDTEKQVAQLEAKLQQTQSQLAQKEAESEKAQQTFPALQVEIVEFFNKSTVIKHKKDPNDEFFREETPVSVFVSVAKTGVEWLDNLLLLNMLDEKDRANLQDKNAIEKALMSRFEKNYQELLQAAKEDKQIGLHFSLNTDYFGQRNNIATFTQMDYAYTGGAHGTHYTKYLNVDINKKVVIRLDDLISAQNQAKLREILWETYRSERLDENGNFVGFVEKSDFFVSEQFYFTPNGIRFVYPLYSIGPYAEGEVELTTSFYEVNELLNPAYQRTKKDGFGLDPTEY